LEVQELGNTHDAAAERCRLACVADLDRDHAIGVAVGEWIEQHVLDDAEDGRGGADAEREREYRQRGEGGLAAQRAQPVPEVVPHAVTRS